MAAPVTHPADIEHPARGDLDDKVSILLVDDREDKLLSLQVVLEDLNERMVVAHSGKEALRILLQQDFAVILLDVNMPGLDGFETAALIRQRQRSETTPIIFVSAINDTENHVSRGYSLGAVDYIVTPVIPEILRAKVSVFVDLFRKTEQVKRQAEERAEFMREQAARAEAEAAQERLAFLADASNVLAGSLDLEETFNSLARLIVPRLADFCVVDIVEEQGTLRQVAVAHRDLDEEPKLRQLSAHYPPNLEARHGGARVFQTGKSEICCDFTEETLEELFEDAATRELLRSLEPRGYIAVPLLARGRVLGAITLVNISPERGCGSQELSLAEELAQRAALALDNAALYKAAHRARLEAERANMAKDRFLAMLSHELRTPLTPVLSSVMSLEAMEELPAGVREGLSMIRRNVQLEARLIDDLLDLTRISKGKVHLHLQNVDGQALLCSAIEICGPEIQAKQHAVITDFHAVGRHVLADPARLQQVFWNLIKNAVKFTPEGGCLTISTTNEPEGSLCVRVSDTGIGVPQEMLPKLFDAFEQGEMAKAGGLGLGLAITKAITEMHHGRIEASSKGRDRGSTFTVSFPLAAAAPNGETPHADEPPAERRALRVLLVEDHEDTNRSLTQLLRRRGYEVRSAKTVDGALQTAGQYEFDVLVSDMGLPDGTGNDLIQKLAEEREVHGIALTGYGMESDLERSQAAGFKHHLIKPIDLDRLDDLIQSSAPPPAS